MRRSRVFPKGTPYARTMDVGAWGWFLKKMCCYKSFEEGGWRDDERDF